MSDNDFRESTVDGVAAVILLVSAAYCTVISELLLAGFLALAGSILAVSYVYFLTK